MADIVTNTLVHTVAPLLLADGLAVANVVGQAMLGVAVSVYLFLRILRFISRKLGRDFTIQYTPPERKPSPWQMVFKDAPKLNPRTRFQCSKSSNLVRWTTKPFMRTWAMA